MRAHYLSDIFVAWLLAVTYYLRFFLSDSSGKANSLSTWMFLESEMYSPNQRLVSNQ